MNTRDNLKSESESPMPTGLLWIFHSCELPDSPDSEFLLPMRPTKMSFISPDKKNEKHLIVFYDDFKEFKESKYFISLPKVLLFCGDCTAFPSNVYKMKSKRKEKREQIITKFPNIR